MTGAGAFALLLLGPAALWAAGAFAAAAPLQLDAMTSPELAARIAAGTTTALLPIGATEQNGPHMVLGKHNVRAQRLAERIAERLGNAVVAPLLAYAPEGDVDPPSGHMRYAGTISIPVAAFEALLEGAARSLCRHGLHDVVLLGDHGGYQASLARVAARLGARRAARPASTSQRPCRVHALATYYELATVDHARWLRERGYTESEIGRHAGLADTSLAWAIDPGLVRQAALASAASVPGVSGDPSRASAALGQSAVERIVEGSVAALRVLLAAAPRR